ncbi:MAG: RNA-splicing ligase RtcB, partial [Halobacteriales archaeon]|nr:RNA-splicing ligase RtcB [Halobacteriales archaeon]
MPLEELGPGDRILRNPFEGIDDEEPPEFVILDEEDFAGEDPQLIGFLNELDLLPLKSTDEAFNHLLKIVGFHTGDGSFSGPQTWFYGDPEDLEAIRADIEAIGFTPSRVYERQRQHEIDGNRFERTEYSFKSGSKAFKALLVQLGVPDGPKVDSAFAVPEYLDRLADWQQALYLSAFFGAEMSAPDTLSAKNFYAPSVSHNRLADERAAGEQFMRDLMRHLNDLGVRTNALEEVERTDRADGPTVRYRFGVKGDSRNLIRFFTRIGYRYAGEKQRRAMLATEYLKRKEQAIERRARIADEAKALADGGMPPGEIESRFDDVNTRFVERSIWSGRKGRPRPPMDFPDFES